MNTTMKVSSISALNGAKVLNQHIDKEFTLWNGDNCKVIDGLPDESVGLVVTSPPFPKMYCYNASSHDIGNTTGIDQMLDHFRFLVRKMNRVIKKGRSVCVHLTNVPLFLGSDDEIGRLDFRGDVIRLFQSEGWTYASEVLIDKCPQLRAVRTKDRGLLFKSLAVDASVMSPVMSDYLLVFRNKGKNKEPIKAGKSVKYGNPKGYITEQEWISWAHSVWYKYDKNECPEGIRATHTLNVAIAREGDDELHLCPLQLDVIERCVKLWSNPDDIVLDPFSGVGSTGHKAIELGRKYLGIELKESYFKTSIKYLKEAQEKAMQPDLFTMFGNDETPEETKEIEE